MSSQATLAVAPGNMPPWAQQLRADIRADMAPLRMDIKKILNRTRDDGHAVAFDIVPFLDGSDPTEQPHGLPPLHSFASIEALDGAALVVYLQNYGVPVPVGADNQPTNRLRKDALKEICKMSHMKPFTLNDISYSGRPQIWPHMEPPSLSMSAVPNFVESMAQEQLRYETIFEEHGRVCRADPQKFEAAMAKVQQSPLVAKFGQRWEPAGDDGVDEYLAHCNDICSSVPQDFNDRVKIMYAAHGALACLVNCKFGRQSENVQLAVMKRHNELMLSAYPTPPIPDNREAPFSKPSAEPRHITPDDLQLFQNPDNLHGKQFILMPETESAGTYEVISYVRKRDKTVWYEVLFDDCEDPIPLDAEAMMAMLEDSLYVPT